MVIKEQELKEFTAVLRGMESYNKIRKELTSKLLDKLYMYDKKHDKILSEVYDIKNDQAPQVLYAQHNYDNGSHSFDLFINYEQEREFVLQYLAKLINIVYYMKKYLNGDFEGLDDMESVGDMIDLNNEYIQQKMDTINAFIETFEDEPGFVKIFSFNFEDFTYKKYIDTLEVFTYLSNMFKKQNNFIQASINDVFTDFKKTIQKNMKFGASLKYKFNKDFRSNIDGILVEQRESVATDFQEKTDLVLKFVDLYSRSSFEEWSAGYVDYLSSLTGRKFEQIH